ncbi:MAG: hypothetical protein IJB96_12300, partial [Lachnospira sp.]|nr:hypothetical protein [Lachnospira sp.]
MHSKRNTLINISLIFITCIVVLVCIVVRPKSNNNITPGESESETTSTSETSVSEEPSTESESDVALRLWYEASFSHLNINLSTSAPQTEPVFNTNAEIYNYAVGQINDRKYYNAIKHLQKIPNYKDSTQLQSKLYIIINQGVLITDYDSGYFVANNSMNTKTVNNKNNFIVRKDSFISNEKLCQQLSEGYIDSNGNFYVTTKMNEFCYNSGYKQLIDYNKTVKFEVVNIPPLANTNASRFNSYILTKEGNIVKLYDNLSTPEIDILIQPIDISILSSTEKIVYITNIYAYSNLGNIYVHTPGWKLNTAPVPNTLAFYNKHGIEFYLTNDGTITYDNYANETDFPAVKQWSDIIFFDAGSSPLNEYPDYCIGLTSSGAIYMALPHDSITKRILDSNCIYIAARAYGDKVYALTDSDDLHIYYIPNFP